MIVAGTNILAIFLMLTTKHKKTRVPMWLNPEATLAEIEPLVANRLLCFRRRFWFSDIDLEQADSKLLYFQYQEIKEHLRIIGSLIKSCSIGLADAAKLVVLLSKIDSRDFKSSGKNERSI
jgi:hypothetical protein